MYGWSRLGHQDPAEALLRGGRRRVVELQLVEAFQVEHHRAERAVDLDPQAVLAAGGEPGRLVRGDRAAVEPGQEQRGVVDGDLARGRRRGAVAGRGGQAARLGRQRPLLDERLGQRADAGDPLAGDELGQVDDVRADVAERAGAGLVLLQPPHQRELRVDDPVLQVDRADVPDRRRAARRRRAGASARPRAPGGS